MALPDLISRLEHEAQSRVQEIEKDTEAEVHAIEAATERAIAEITARHLEHQHAERRALQQRELALVQRQARARELEAHHTLLVRILQRAKALLPDIAASTSYRDALPAHLDEALSFLEDLQPRVRCQAAFAPILQATIARRSDAVLVIDESVGPGVQAEATDRSVIVDNTLASRLARAEARIAIELSRQLPDVQ
jgi:vacuolar-type H+-ATPase subunit E/Vma4